MNIKRIIVCSVNYNAFLCAMSRRKRPDYETAYLDYKAGMSLEQIADRMIISRQGVYAGFKRRGYKLRGKNFQIPKTPITEDGLVVGLGFRKIFTDHGHVYEYGSNLGRMFIQITKEFKTKEFWVWSECIQLECDNLQDLETMIKVLKITPDGKEENKTSDTP